MYAKARRGEITHFTGVNDPYEEPLMPDLRIDTSSLTPSEALDRVLNVIKTT
jgi:adenylylsulfate kinase-like enzyme